MSEHVQARVAAAFRKLRYWVERASYRPERHYMRGRPRDTRGGVAHP